MTTEQKEKILSDFEENKILVQKAEKRLAELREKIIRDIGTGKHGEFLVMVSDQDRESFSLKEARLEATPGFLEKLKQFVRHTKYQTVKVERI